MEEKDTREEKEQETEEEVEKLDEFLESFEEADEDLERLVTPKRRKTHASAYSKLEFYNSTTANTPAAV